jgi:hypothetical protein
MHFKNIWQGFKKREKIMPFTQDRLNSIWKRLQDGSECNDFCRLDLGDGVDAWMPPHVDLEQTLGFSRKPAPYCGSNGDGTDIFYTRTQLAEGTPWGMWK